MSDDPPQDGELPARVRLREAIGDALFDAVASLEIGSTDWLVMTTASLVDAAGMKAAQLRAEILSHTLRSYGWDGAILILNQGEGIDTLGPELRKKMYERLKVEFESPPVG